MIRESVQKTQDADVIQVRVSGDPAKAQRVRDRVIETLGDWVVEAGGFFRNRFDVGSRCYISVKPPEADD